MPNRKEPRLALEEPQLNAEPVYEAAPLENTENAETVKETVASTEATDVSEVTDRFEFSDLASTSPNASPKQRPQTNEPIPKRPKAPKGSAGKAWLGIVLALVALGGLGWQFMQFQQASLLIEQQQESMQLLGNRIQELELRLLETGDDLSAAGSSFNEKLTWADSEIRKLWVVAHQRNRPAIDTLESKASQLEQALGKLTQQQSDALEASKEALESSKKATEQTASLAKTSKANNEALKAAVEKLNLQAKSLMQRLMEVSLIASTLDERLRNQDLRIKLTALEKRVTELGTKANNVQPEPNKLPALLAEQQEILTSLEASRAQLVSRVTRLMDEVRELQQRR